MKAILSYDRNIEEMEEDSMKPVIVRNVSIGEGMPKICVPIVGKTEDEILQAAKEIVNVPADLVEWRADWYESVFEMQKYSQELKLLSPLKPERERKALMKASCATS